MTLKEIMKQDVNIFLNIEEIADYITYNGEEIKAIIDLQGDRENGNTFINDGQSAQVMIQIACADIPSPKQGDEIIFHNTFNLEDYIIGDENNVIGDEIDPASYFLKEIFGGYNWEVVRIVNSDGVMYKLECIANESPW